MPYACYRTVVNENVHTLSVVALAAATAEATTQLEDKHTFAISVPAVAADKTKTQYDAGTGAYSVKLFPADDGTQGEAPVAFVQLEELLAHRFVADPDLASGPFAKARAVEDGL